MTLEQLVAARLAAKAVEVEATEKRRAIDMQIVAALNPNQDEGTVTTTVGDRKVQVSCSVNRKIDAAVLLQEFPTLSDEVRNAFRWKPELDLRAYNALDPRLMKTAGRYITTKPSAPVIRID
jgi:hypothetical protein